MIRPSLPGSRLATMPSRKVRASAPAISILAKDEMSMMPAASRMARHSSATMSCTGVRRNP